MSETTSVSTRIPQGWLVAIERHQQRMRQTTRTPRVTLADALRDLIALGIESQEPGIRLFGGETAQAPSPLAAASMPAAAPPGASAIEQAAAAATPTTTVETPAAASLETPAAPYIPPGMQSCLVNPRHQPFPMGQRCLACRQNEYARQSRERRKARVRSNPGDAQ